MLLSKWYPASSCWSTDFRAPNIVAPIIFIIFYVWYFAISSRFLPSFAWKKASFSPPPTSHNLYMLLYAADYTSLLEGALLTATSSAHFRRPRRRHLAEGRYGVLRSLQCYDRSEAGDSEKAACSPARVCGCTHTHTHTHLKNTHIIRMYVHTNICKCTCKLYVCTYVYILSIYAYIYICIYIYMYMYILTHTHTCIYIVHIYIYTCIYIS